MAHNTNAAIVLPSTRVLGVAELLEQILFELAREHPSYGSDPLKKLFVLQKVNATFQNVIASSLEVRERMWLSVSKNRIKKYQHAPMRWLIVYLGVSSSPNWEAHYPIGTRPSAFMGVRLPMLNLECVENSQVLGHSLRFDRLRAPPSKCAHIQAAHSDRTRPSWWKMTIFRVDTALPLRIWFEVRYDGFHTKRKKYAGELHAICRKNCTLGGFVSQYLKAIRVTDHGEILGEPGVSAGRPVILDQRLELGSAYRPVVIEKWQREVARLRTVEWVDQQCITGILSKGRNVGLGLTLLV